MDEEVGAEVQTIKVRDTQGSDKILGMDGGHARHQTRSRYSRSNFNLEIAKNGTPVDELPGFCELLREFIKGYADNVYPMQQLMRQKDKNFTWNNAAEESFQRMKKELCEAPVLGMSTEKGIYVLDMNESVVAISGLLHQEQEFLRPIAYGSKVLSDTEMKYVAPKAEKFALVIFVEKYRAYLGSEPFKLRVDNRALSWLKTYSKHQSYIGK